MKKWIFAFVVAFLASLALSVPVYSLRVQYNEQAYQSHRLQARDHLNFIRDDIQSKLDSNLFYADFFEMIIRQNPSITENELREYARLIVERNEIVDNITLAKDGVVHFVYPLRGNEEVLGLDLFDNNPGMSTLETSMEYRTAITQGPVQAIQGGVKLFNRKPIFIESISAEDLWGFANVTVDFEELLEQTIQTHRLQDYNYAIHIESDVNESILWGEEEVFQEDAITQMISLPENSWRLAIIPVNGWNTSDFLYSGEMMIFYVLISIIFVLVFFFVNHYANKREQSRMDSLTGLLNKRTFESACKRILKYSTQKNGLLLIDFNDFKKINDKYGHLAGDRVLQETAERMKDIIKQSDKIGRIGGDEFMIIVKDIRTEDNLQKVADRILDHVQRPIFHKEEEITPSISIGFAVTDSTEAFEKIYDSVDEKMYSYKEEFKQSQKQSLT